VPSSENLTIDTPEQIVLELPLAGIGSRLLAFVFDTLLQVIVFVVVLLVLVVAAAAWRSQWNFLAWVPGYLIAPLLIFFVFCLYWGYFALFEIFWHGQTPGKRYAGIRVLKDTGRSANVFECIGRNFLRAVDWLPAFYGVGLICIMVSKQHRRLGDYVAGTVVIHDKAMHEVRPDWSSSAERAEVHPEVTKISSDELVLIETYLNRRLDLDPAVREDSAQRIALLISTKCGLQPAPDQSPDDFLETIAREVRDSARFR
jgi:uncharacterized RDD family membrane protein YckC